MNLLQTTALAIILAVLGGMAVLAVVSAIIGRYQNARRYGLPALAGAVAFIVPWLPLPVYAVLGLAAVGLRGHNDAEERRWQAAGVRLQPGQAADIAARWSAIPAETRAWSLTALEQIIEAEPHLAFAPAMDPGPTGEAQPSAWQRLRAEWAAFWTSDRSMTIARRAVLVSSLASAAGERLSRRARETLQAASPVENRLATPVAR